MMRPGEEIENVNKALMNAVLEGDLEEVKKCIKVGADLNYMSKTFQTPLQIAAWQGK